MSKIIFYPVIHHKEHKEHKEKPLKPFVTFVSLWSNLFPLLAMCAFTFAEVAFQM